MSFNVLVDTGNLTSHSSLELHIQNKSEVESEGTSQLTFKFVRCVRVVTCNHSTKRLCGVQEASKSHSSCLCWKQATLVFLDLHRGRLTPPELLGFTRNKARHYFPVLLRRRGHRNTSSLCCRNQPQHYFFMVLFDVNDKILVFVYLSNSHFSCI